MTQAVRQLAEPRIPALLQVQERAKDAPDGGQLAGADCTETVVQALVGHRARVLGPRVGRKFGQTGRPGSDGNLVPEPAVSARDWYYKHDRMRQS